MSEPTSTRYPGARSFQDTNLDRQLFRGREEEKAALLHLVLSERLVVVYARSGVGKSSLINAGLLEPLRAEGYIPLVCRVNDPSRGAFAPLYEHIEEGARREGVEYVAGDQKSLWHCFKTAEFWRGDLLLTPVLIIDQFEELFTLLSREQREEFIGQFADLVRGRPPRADSTPSEESDPSALGDAPPSVKIVLSLREDFLPHLRELYVKIPNIHHTHFPLTTLGRQQARRAIEEPAKLQVGELRTPRFEYAPSTVDQLIDFLCQRRVGDQLISGDEVEPFQLQLICQHVERMVDARARDTKGPLSISFAELGGEPGLRQIIANFYADEARAMAPRYSRRAIAKLCEDGLVSPSGWRLSVEAGELTARFKVPIEALDELVDRRLLRSERRLGSVYYELSHDTLLAPVVAARARRRSSRKWGGIAAAAALVALAGGAFWYVVDRDERRQTLRSDALRIDDIAQRDPAEAIVGVLDVVARSDQLFSAPPPEVSRALAMSIDLASVHSDVVFPEAKADGPLPSQRLDVHPSGTFVAVGRPDGHVVLRDLAGHDLAVSTAAHAGEVAALAFRAGGTELVSLGADGALRSWTWESAEARPPIDLRAVGATALSLEPEGLLAAVAGPGTATQLIDLESGAITELSESPSGVGVKFGHNGVLAVLADGRQDVDLWNLDVLEKGPVRVGLAPGMARSSSRSADGKWVAIADYRGIVHVFDEEWKSKFTTSKGGTTGRTALDQSGQRLAVTRRDVLEVYAAPLSSATDGGKPILTRELDEKLFGLAFTPGGEHVLVGGRDGIVCSFPVPVSMPKEVLGSAETVGKEDVAPTEIERGTAAARIPADRCPRGEVLPKSRGPHDRPNELITSIVPTRRWLLIGSMDGTLQILHLDGSEPVATMTMRDPETGHYDPVSTIVVDTEEKRAIAGTGSGQLHVIDLEHPERKARPKRLDPLSGEGLSRDLIEALGVSKGGTWLASLSADGVIAVHSIGTGRLSWSTSLPAEFESPRDDWTVGVPLVVSDDGRRVKHVQSDGVEIEITAGLTPEVEAKVRPVKTILVSPRIRELLFIQEDNELYALSDEGEAWKHDLSSEEGGQFELEVLDDDEDIRLQSFANHSSAGEGLFVTRAGELLYTERGVDRPVAAGLGSIHRVSFDEDGRVAFALAADGRLRSFSLEGMDQIGLDESEAIVAAATHMSNGGVIVAASGDEIQLLDPELGPLTAKDDDSKCESIRAVEAPRNEPWFLVLCDSGKVEGWSLTSGYVVDDVVESVFGAGLIGAGLDREDWPVAASPEVRVTTAMAVSPKGNLAVLGSATGILYFLANPWSPYRATPEGPPTPFRNLGPVSISSLAISSDSTQLAVGLANGTVRLCLLEGEFHCSEEQPDSPHGDGPVQVAFTSDGEALLTGGQDGRIVRWGLDLTEIPWTTEEGGARMVQESGPVTAIAVSATQIATSSRDGKITLWSIGGDRVAKITSADAGEHASLRFSPLLEDRLLVAGEGAELRRIDVSLDSWLRTICWRADPILRTPRGEDRDNEAALTRAREACAASRLLPPSRSAAAELPHPLDHPNPFELRAELHRRLGARTDTAALDKLLRTAIRRQDPLSVSMLLDLGANVSAQDELGRSPLHEAAWSGSRAILDMLLRRVSDVGARDASGATPLHYASYRGHANPVKMLVARGAVVDVVNDRGATPLMLAGRAGHARVVSTLIESGADVTLADAFGRTAKTWVMAAEDGSEAAAILESFDSSPEPGGWTDGRDREPMFSVAETLLPEVPSHFASDRDAILSWQTGGSADAIERAFSRFEKAANDGDPFATYLVGRAFHYGFGVGRDRSRSIPLYREAAEADVALAQTALALALYNGQGVKADPDEAAEWLDRAARSGHPWAALLRADALQGGRFGERDEAGAFEMGNSLSGQGFPRATNWVGIAFENGNGVEKDVSAALSYYEQAALLGSLSAYCNLSHRYMTGISGTLERDVERAEWLAARCAGDEERAAFGHRVLSYIRSSGLDGRAPDRSGAITEVAETAIADGWSAYLLGNWIEEAEGNPSALPEAVRLYREAADQRHAPSEARLKHLRVTP